MEYTRDQKREIQAGNKSGVDTAIYSDPGFPAVCMREIRLGLEHGVDVSVYADLCYDWFQMEEIRRGLEQGLDVSKYKDAAIPYMVMREIRIALESGLDLSAYRTYPAGILRQLRLACHSKTDIVPYIRGGYDAEQIDEIRQAKEHYLPIDGYITKYFRPVAIHEIAEGLARGIDVSEYADIRYFWQQMREIRLGLEHRVDVSIYKNPLYSWQQMREIRLGLECGGDVSSYKSFIYTAAEMAKKRIKLGYIPTESLSADSAHAKAHDDDRRASDYIRMPIAGKDGSYEILVKGCRSTLPQINDDDSVVHGDVSFFTPVKAGMAIVLYHRATRGVDGIRKDGTTIPERDGRELEPLEGYGFRIREDGLTYEAAIDGRMILDGGHLYVRPFVSCETISGLDEPIDINGDLYVAGDIKAGAKVNATGDIIVSGSAENAIISAGGDIVIAHGAVFNGEGVILAGGNLYAKYLQNAIVGISGDIRTDYISNSEAEAGGSVYVLGDKGKITGGVVSACRNIVAKVIGNSMGTSTAVKAGTTGCGEADLTEIKKQKEACISQIKLLKEHQHTIERDYRPEQRNAMTVYIKIGNAIYTKEEEMKSLDEKAAQITETIKKARSACVVVKKEIFEGVDVSLAGKLWHSTNQNKIIVSMTGTRIQIKGL